MSHIKHIYLIRHAKAEASGFSLNDFDRPLAERGVDAAGIMGKRLADMDARPDLVLCSPARRTRGTWDVISSSVPAGGVVFEPQMYEATWKELLNLLRQVPADVESVLMIGHNPSMGELALHLADPSASPDKDGLHRMRTNFPTCSLAKFHFLAAKWSALSSHSCLLHSFLTPKGLRLNMSDDPHV